MESDNRHDEELEVVEGHGKDSFRVQLPSYSLLSKQFNPFEEMILELSGNGDARYALREAQMAFLSDTRHGSNWRLWQSAYGRKLNRSNQSWILTLIFLGEMLFILGTSRK